MDPESNKSGFQTLLTSPPDGPLSGNLKRSTPKKSSESDKTSGRSKGSKSVNALETNATVSSSEAKTVQLNSIFRCRCGLDWFARTCFVGIFVVENVFHFLNFEVEIDSRVGPAIFPLPRQLGVL